MRFVRPLLLVVVGVAVGILARPLAGKAYRALAGRNLSAEPSPVAPPDPTIPVERETHRHLAFMRDIDRGPKTVPVVLLGDSITECWRLVPDLQEQAFGQGVRNLGIGADGIEHVLWRVQNGELDGYRAKKIVIAAGTNNVTRGHPPEAITAAIPVLIAEVRKRQPEAEIVLFPLLPRDPHPTDPDRVAVSKINATLAQTPGVRWVDASACFLAPDGTISRELMPDYRHPSPAAYQRWAESLAPHFPR